MGSRARARNVVSEKIFTKLEISIETMERLKKIAQPFTDTPDSVISRLLNYYEETRHVVANECSNSEEFFKTKDGTRIPLVKIYGKYRPRGYKSTHTIIGRVTKTGIEVNGEVFSDLSSAAKHGKKNLGVDDSAASTNGWKFWKIMEGEKKNLLLDDFRKKQKHEGLTLEDLGL